MGLELSEGELSACLLRHGSSPLLQLDLWWCDWRQRGVRPSTEGLGFAEPVVEEVQCGLG